MSASPPIRAVPPGAVEHRCPLCGGRFAEERHCSICPMTAYCHTLCCPHCGYSFVERSTLVDMGRRLLARLRGAAAAGRAGRG